MKLFHWLVTLPLAVVVAIFAVSNRSSVTLAFWPFPLELETPVFAIVLLTLLLGFIVGFAAGWIGSWRVRREARQRAKRIEALERDLAAAEKRLEPPPAAGLITHP